MSDWTHAICDDCWDTEQPNRPSPRKGTGEIEHCCYCGRHTVSGIYIRADPTKIVNHDQHKMGIADR